MNGDIDVATQATFAMWINGGVLLFALYSANIFVLRKLFMSDYRHLENDTKLFIGFLWICSPFTCPIIVVGWALIQIGRLITLGD
jgi:hypothetical protein